MNLLQKLGNSSSSILILKQRFYAYLSFQFSLYSLQNWLSDSKPDPKVPLVPDHSSLEHPLFSWEYVLRNVRLLNQSIGDDIAKFENGRNNPWPLINKWENIPQSLTEVEETHTGRGKKKNKTNNNNKKTRWTQRVYKDKQRSWGVECRQHHQKDVVLTHR